LRRPFCQFVPSLSSEARCRAREKTIDFSSANIGMCCLAGATLNSPAPELAPRA
jgi:hypothetical protein